MWPKGKIIILHNLMTFPPQILTGLSLQLKAKFSIQLDELFNEKHACQNNLDSLKVNLENNIVNNANFNLNLKTNSCKQLICNR